MKSFTELLKHAEENQIDAHQMLTAVEVKKQLACYDIKKLTEEEFESVCKFVHDWTMNTTATHEEVVCHFVDVIESSYVYTYSNFTKYEREITNEINWRF